MWWVVVGVGLVVWRFLGWVRLAGGTARCSCSVLLACELGVVSVCGMVGCGWGVFGGVDGLWELILCVFWDFCGLGCKWW